MIVSWEHLPELAGEVVMVDGSFDPLHDGHIAYFAAARDFGDSVLCNITHDSWTMRKHRVLLPQTSRAVVIDALRDITYVHCSNMSTKDVLERLRPRVYVKGSDWLQRGGIPEDERVLCDRLSIRVEYVDTVLNSSSRLLEQFEGR
jgi:cytidyltransferase-like protein